MALIVLGLAVFLLSFFCQYRTAGLGVYLEIEAEKSDVLQIYWRSADESFQEQQSWKTTIRGAGITSVSTTLPMASKIDFIRIDPGTRPAEFRIVKALLSYGDDEHLNLLDIIRTASFTTSHQLNVHSRPAGVLLEALGIDPYFEVHASIDADLILHWKRAIPSLLFACLLLYLLLHQGFLKGSKQGGILRISLPDHIALRLPPAQESYRLHPRMTRSRSERLTTYGLEVTDIEPLSLAELINNFKQYNDTADIRFQYRRSGDV